MTTIANMSSNNDGARVYNAYSQYSGTSRRYGRAGQGTTLHRGTQASNMTRSQLSSARNI